MMASSWSAIESKDKQEIDRHTSQSPFSVFLPSQSLVVSVIAVEPSLWSHHRNYAVTSRGSGLTSDEMWVPSGSCNASPIEISGYY